MHRKVQELGLRQCYDEDLEYAHLVKCMTALSFVPTADVEGLFESLSEEFPQNEASDELLSYFKSTHIQGPISGAEEGQLCFQ